MLTTTPYRIVEFSSTNYAFQTHLFPLGLAFLVPIRRRAWFYKGPLKNFGFVPESSLLLFWVLLSPSRARSHQPQRL